MKARRLAALLDDALALAREGPPVALVDAAEMRRRVREPLPEDPTSDDDQVASLLRRAEVGISASSGPRFFGWVVGGLLPAALEAGLATVALDQNVALWREAPAAAEVEWLALDWIKLLLGLPADADAAFTTGATLANTISLAAMRHAVARRLGIDVENDGVMLLPPNMRLYASEDLHVSDLRALRTLGLGTNCVHLVPCDDRHQLRGDAVSSAIAADRRAGLLPVAVIAQAGSVNTGSCDAIIELADICQRDDLWLHVDGAFGAFFAVSPKTAHLVEGMERADSLAVDGHKWMNLPYGTGFVFVREPGLLRATFELSASYLAEDPGSGLDPAAVNLEYSRGWRGLTTWAALRSLGRSGVVDLVDRCVGFAAHLASAVERAPGLEIMAPVVSNVTCFRSEPDGLEAEALDEHNRAVQARVAERGRVFFTGTQLRNGYAFRPCFVNWKTTTDDVDLLLEEVLAAVKEVGT